jgi:hypothetical protein
MWEAHPNDWATDGLAPGRGDESAVLRPWQTDACVHLLLTIIQKAENVVPSTTKTTA